MLSLEELIKERLKLNLSYLDVLIFMELLSWCADLNFQPYNQLPMLGTEFD